MKHTIYIFISLLFLCAMGMQAQKVGDVSYAIQLEKSQLDTLKGQLYQLALADTEGKAEVTIAMFFQSIFEEDKARELYIDAYHKGDSLALAWYAYYVDGDEARAASILGELKLHPRSFDDLYWGYQMIQSNKDFESSLMIQAENIILHTSLPDLGGFKPTYRLEFLYKRAVQLLEANPKDPAAKPLLREVVEAVPYFENYREHMPSYVTDAYVQYVTYLARQGNDTEALRYIRKAYAQHVSDSLTSAVDSAAIEIALGYFDEDNEASDKKALAYFHLAAEEGHNRYGYFALGLYHEEGLAEQEHSLVRAFGYYLLSAEQGHSKALAKLEEIVKKNQGDRELLQELKKLLDNPEFGRGDKEKYKQIYKLIDEKPIEELRNLYGRNRRGTSSTSQSQEELNGKTSQE